MAELKDRLDEALGERYAVGEAVGEGGMAVVFGATDRKHGRRVAIKVLRPDVGSSLGPERFLREIEIAAGCTHPNILPVHDSGSAGGLLYFVMPLVPGPNLRDRIEEGPMDVAEAVRISGEIAGALAYAHDQGLIHRDVKPGNILFVAGHAAVTDFGVARAVSEAGGGERLTGTGVSVGTLDYMSPEQASGEGAVDARSDQYALACMVEEMLTGRRLFRGMGARSVVARKLTAEGVDTVSAELPLSIRQVLARARAIDPDERFPTVEAFRAALERASTESEAARVEQAAGRRGRMRAAAGTAGVVAVVLLVLWVTGLTSGPRYERVAVLPLQNAGLPADDFFIEGILDGLIAGIGEAGAQVTNPRSVRRFGADDAIPIRDIADTLGIDAVVEGTAVRRGESIQVSLRLSDGESEIQVWQQDFSGPSARILDLYEEMAAAVVSEMGLDVSRPFQEQLAQERRVDPRAYEAFVRGQFHWNRLTPADLQLAEENFRLALEIDPDYADAHAAMGQLAAGLQQFGLLPPAAALPRWQAGASNALAVDSANALAWSVLAAFQAWGDWDFPASRVSHERALAINPSDARTRAYYAHVLMILGHQEAALAEAGKALAADPLNGLVSAMHCVVRAVVSAPEVAEPHCTSALELDPTNPVGLDGMLVVQSRAGAPDRVASLAAVKSTVLGQPAVAEVIRSAKPEGGKVAMRRGAEFLESVADTAFVLPSDIVSLYADSDTPERAVPWLLPAAEAGGGGPPYFGVIEVPAVIAESPEMAELLERVGVPNQNLGR